MTASDVCNHVAAVIAYHSPDGISGAGQGIGRAVAHGFGEAGAAVAVVDIAGDKAEAVASELQARGIRSISIQADVRSKNDCDRCAYS